MYKYYGGRDRKLSYSCKNVIVFCIKKERCEGVKLGKDISMRRFGKVLLRELG